MNDMRGRPSAPRGGRTERRGRWYGAGSDLLLLAAGLSWASVWAASCLASPLYLAFRMHDDTAGGAGDDL